MVWPTQTLRSFLTKAEGFHNNFNYSVVHCREPASLLWLFACQICGKTDCSQRVHFLLFELLFLFLGNVITLESLIDVVNTVLLEFQQARSQAMFSVIFYGLLNLFLKIEYVFLKSINLSLVKIYCWLRTVFFRFLTGNSFLQKFELSGFFFILVELNPSMHVISSIAAAFFTSSCTWIVDPTWSQNCLILAKIKFTVFVTNLLAF